MESRNTDIFPRSKSSYRVNREKITIQFTPHLVPVNRGIITTIYVDLSEKIDAESLASIYQKAYGNEPFVRLLGTERFPDSKNVSGTNFIDIAWRLDLRTGRAILMSAIDNIVKAPADRPFNVSI